MDNDSDFEADAITRICQVISMIPPARVATYGQVAELAGLPRRARLVGRILSQLPADSTLPWFRVISASGLITNPMPKRQADRLRADGVVVRGTRVNLRHYRWETA